MVRWLRLFPCGTPTENRQYSPLHLPLQYNSYTEICTHVVKGLPSRSCFVNPDLHILFAALCFSFSQPVMNCLPGNADLLCDIGAFLSSAAHA